jgi:uncharacterized membrane-anchored protein YjiN (DUF445 family)
VTGPVLTDAAGPLVTDADRARGLRRMRTLAFSLLVLAAVVYVLTHGRSGGWGYLNAAAEASMVGAIADWFAVTALFRHPLGLPIPHTALIPTRKQALARSLQDFVTTNFLSDQIVRDRMRQARLGERVGGWLAEEPNSRRVADEAAALARTALLRVSDDDVTTLVRDEIIPRLIEEPVSELAGGLLAQVVAEGTHRPLVDLVLTEAHTWLVANPDRVAGILNARAPWWTPRWLDERVVTRVQLEVVDWVAEIRDDHDHPVRRALDDALARLADDLQNDDETRRQTEDLKARLLRQPELLTATVSLWGSLRRAVVTALEDETSELRRRMAATLSGFGAQLRDEPELRDRVDSAIEDAVAFLVGRYGGEITTVITDTIDRWDGVEAARRIELHVGRDLQFIRINGTLVGGIAGLVIHAVTVLA